MDSIQSQGKVTPANTMAGASKVNSSESEASKGRRRNRRWRPRSHASQDGAAHNGGTPAVVLDTVPTVPSQSGGRGPETEADDFGIGLDFELPAPKQAGGVAVTNKMDTEDGGTETGLPVETEQAENGNTSEKKVRRRRRRSRGRGRGNGTGSPGAETDASAAVQGEAPPSSSATVKAAPAQSDEADSKPDQEKPGATEPPPSGRRRRSRGRRHGTRQAEEQPKPANGERTTVKEIAPGATDAETATEEPAEEDAPLAERRETTFREPGPIKPDERVMLINVAEGEEGRIAIIYRKRLEELFIERASSQSHVGNIYKGRVTNVEPSIQAAFVDFGLPRNGFLHISDLQPQYFPEGMRQIEEVGRKTPRRDRPLIQKCLRRGQEVIVQIIKEGIGTKGPTLTTYVSIPGRYLVMMPGMNRLGVSRKIEDEDARRKMRKVLEELDFPKEMGFILRTAGMDQTKRELQRDLNYLQRLWKAVAERVRRERAPCELYRESDLVIRTIRDVYTSDFSRVIVDSAEAAERVRDFLSIAMPRSSSTVEVLAGTDPLFHKFAIEQEIEQLYSRTVPLPSGGSLVIDSTEALVAIDVNSGRCRDHDDAEETAFRINMEAAEEIARQLRLRDLGGLILCDFIDMRAQKHCRSVERALRDAMKKHKERAKCLRMSQFGIIEMTRQRMRPSIKRSIYQDCPHCGGAGLIKNTESMTLDMIRLLRLAAHHEQVETVSVKVAASVAGALQNQKRTAICELEQKSGVRITIHADRTLGLDQYLFECFDRRGGLIHVVETPQTRKSGGDRRGRQRVETPEVIDRDEPQTLDEMFD